MSEADRRAYIIADNRLAEEAEWSKALLRSELSGLIEMGYEVELTGFDTFEIDGLLSLGESEPADDVVELPDERTVPVSRVGDLWTIGEHRMIVGDARDPAIYERLLRGERARIVITDPPYGCVISNNVSGNGRVKHGDFVMGAGEQSLPEFAMTLLRPAFRAMAAHCAPAQLHSCSWTGVALLTCSMRPRACFTRSRTSSCGPSPTPEWAPSTGLRMSFVTRSRLAGGARQQHRARPAQSQQRVAVPRGETPSAPAGWKTSSITPR
jgi:hypothetical protein